VPPYSVGGTVSNGGASWAIRIDASIAAPSRGHRAAIARPSHDSPDQAA
jgi:hypothetical protein